ncbi:unnamed protein product [Brassica rapa subsp. trilocularis]
MRSLRLSIAVLAAVFVCLSILQSTRAVAANPSSIKCIIPYGLCSPADPPGETCNERCLKSERISLKGGKCITNPGNCMCCYDFGV